MERGHLQKILNKTLQILLPVLLGAGIMWWTYRDFNFERAWEVLRRDMFYGWMALSLFFGIISHLVRAWRWQLLLEPLDEHPNSRLCISAIFVSYAANLVLPRVGEVSRCTILSKYDGTSFSKSLGTVVTERAIDTLSIGVIALLAFGLQADTFLTFFQQTGTNADRITSIFASSHFYILLLCLVSLGMLLYWLVRNVTFFARVKGLVQNIWVGILSLREMKRKSLFLLYTVLLWLCYFLQFFLAFYCFEYTSHLGVMAGLVMFVVGSIAVIVPTPNGAGPWHFAIITMMVLYGVGEEDAGIFALLVHGIQTFLLILLGIYGLVDLPLTKQRNK